MLSGKPVKLADYVGQSIVLIFVSPHCGSCRRKFPLFAQLSIQAKERANVELILVSHAGASETVTWMNAIREEDGVEVDLPFLIAPFTYSEFLKIYNPRGLTPYYCLINRQGIVQARGPLGMGEWPKLQQEWEGPMKISPFSRLYS